MATSLEFHIKSYISTAAIVPYVLVKKSGDEVVVAGADDTPIGITMAPAAAGTVVPVRLLNGFGTALIKANAAITKNAVVRIATSGGLIDDGSTGVVIGTAEEAASAQNDVIEVLLAGAPLPFTASVNQAVATDASSVIVLANALRTAAITAGIIKGAA